MTCYSVLGRHGRIGCKVPGMVGTIPNFQVYGPDNCSLNMIIMEMKDSPICRGNIAFGHLSSSSQEH